MGTIYVSGIADDIEDVIRFWASYYGQPHHTIMNIFYRIILSRPWTAYIVPAGEMELKFREALRAMLDADPELSAAVGDRFPEAGKRVPSLVELVSPAAVGEKIGPVFSSQLKELEEARKNRLARLKRGIRDVITATDDDEPEEEEQ